MMKPGASALNAGSLDHVPGPVQTLNFERITGSTISMGALRYKLWIVILVVSPLANSSAGIVQNSKASAGTRNRSMVRAPHSVDFDAHSSIAVNLEDFAGTAHIAL